MALMPIRVYPLGSLYNMLPERSNYGYAASNNVAMIPIIKKTVDISESPVGQLLSFRIMRACLHSKTC